ncbi:hypothetical protein S225a_04200 [Candidatus Brocadiaceae bacterium S225]|nr:hypothetical protein S225a_04200 [Candidatus Brocadiaceae bacterium S225]
MLITLRLRSEDMDDSFLKIRTNKWSTFNSNNKRKDCHPYLLDRF